MNSTDDTITPCRFPFGQRVKTLSQQDRSPKKVFVLGVYASAVHARWIAPKGRKGISALAVASEPCIFWTGKGAEDIIRGIPVPSGVGKLVAAQDSMNGPSGRSLDEHFLAPLLGSTHNVRNEVWLCDLVPHSCMNPRQEKAIKDHYAPLVREFRLQEVTLPSVPKKLCDDARRQEILDELIESKAEILMLLGDEPISSFLNRYAPRWKRLSDFGRTPNTYGRQHPVAIAGRTYQVLPLVHPRQAAKLGTYSPEWHALHRGWVQRQRNRPER